MRKYFFYSAGLIGFLVIATSLAGAADYYVSSSQGNDNNPGTVALPWKTIGKANNTLQAGDAVYLRAGTYSESIRPVRSGAAGKYIKYEAYASDAVIISGAAQTDLTDKSYIKINKINYQNMASGQSWIYFYNSHHNIVENCTFETTSSNMASAGFPICLSDYNIIRGCSFSSACKPTDHLPVQASAYNLIENCNFGNVAHTSLGIRQTFLGISHHNVVRNNYFANRLHHNISTFKGGDYTLIEGNRSYDAGADCGATSCSDANPCGDVENWLRSGANGLKVAADYNIIRNNFFTGNGNVVFSVYDGEAYTENTNNRVYHNTSHQNYIDFHVVTDDTTGKPIENNIVLNNIFSYGIEYSMKIGVAMIETSNDFVSNNIYGGVFYYKGKTTVASAETAYPAEIYDTISLDPGFTDAANRDFSLRASSRMIDAAAWLTVTSAAGSGKTIRVDDATYFMDGWGIIEGDLIQLEGQTTTVRVTAVNYNTNAITVNNSLSWTKGQGVSLPYNGLKPDIGAYEYQESATPAPVAPRGLTVR